MANYGPTRKEILQIQNIDLADVWQGKKTGVEENVKLKIILPLLEELGFNRVSDMDFEHFVENKRADIAILVKKEPKIIVECKSLEKNLDDYISQALGYAVKKQIPYVLLTNGTEFRLYKSFIENLVNPKDRLLSLVKLKTLEKDFDELKEWISKASLEEKKLDKKAKKIEEELRQKITSKTLIENLKNAKQLLSENAKEKILPKFSRDNQFRELVDKWILDSGLDVKKHEVWVKILANEMAYSFINKLYFYRIAEDKGIVRPKLNKRAIGQLTQYMDYNEVINSGFAEILRIDYEAIFKHDLFDKLEFDERLLKKIVDSLSEYNFAAIDSDILGKIYQQHVSKDERKALGQFYTPEWIIDFILDSIPFKTSDKVLDPACGSGGFLIRAYDRLNENYLKERADKNKIHQIILEKNIFGQDINPFAVHLTAMNLALKNIEKKTDTINVLERDSLSFKIDDFIKTTKTKTLDNQEQEIDATKHILKSDIIIGNPPYFNLAQDQIKKKYAGENYSAIASGVTNIAALFLKRYIDLLNDEGYLGFVVPKSILYSDSWRGIRKYILSNCSIDAIYDLHEAFDGVLLEQIVLILRKTTNQKTKNVKVNYVCLPYKLNSTKSHLVGASLFNEHEFPIYCFKENLLIRKKMEENAKILSMISESPRGLPLQKFKYLFTDKPQSPEDKAIVAGQNIEKFGLSGVKYYPAYRSEFEAYKRKSQIFSEPKIMIQNIVAQTSNHIVIIATLDNSGSYNLDTVNNIFTTDKDFELPYVLGFLNSKLAAYYAFNFIFQRAVRTMHFESLRKLPIKQASKEQQTEIGKIVQNLSSIRDKKSKEAFDLMDVLNEKIYGIYGLSKKQIQLIDATFK